MLVSLDLLEISLLKEYLGQFLNILHFCQNILRQIHALDEFQLPIMLVNIQFDILIDIYLGLISKEGLNCII